MTRRLATPARRIAFVGVGPKGLFCLERLAVEVQRHRPSALAVDLFEPHASPGAGPVYAPDQPPFLRMNFANRHIDAWSRLDDSKCLSFPRLTLVEWLKEHHPGEASPFGHAPRAWVGDYLHECFRSIASFLHSRLSLTLRHQRIDHVSRQGEGWLLKSGLECFTADEVLIATGHDSQVAPRRGVAVFPIDRPAGLSTIPAASVVAVRGFALTAIDAALALTEGRGGRFDSSAGPSRLQYRPGDGDVAAIVPFSRTGRPMRPKPDGRCTQQVNDHEDIWHRGRQRLKNHEATKADAVWPMLRRVLCESATEAFACSLDQRSGRQSTGNAQPARRYLKDLLMPSGAFSPQRLEADMRRSLEVAYGLRPATLESSFGAAWRGLYPALVQLVEGRRIDATDWPSFAALAREMERIAFGPPAENSARFLALVEAGKIDLRFCRNPTLTPAESGVSLQLSGEQRSARVLVDAVLSPPGGTPHGSPLLRQLLDRGLVRTQPWHQGIEVRADGGCIGRDGQLTSGLSMIGRATEGSVLGNDTLSRTLHSTPEAWARAVVDRLALTGDSVRIPAASLRS